MIEVKLGLALMNKPGWNPWDTDIPLSIPYKGGRPIRDYIRRPFPMGVKILEAGDFDDKLLIYRECISSYQEIYSKDETYKYISLVDIVYQSVSRGDCRGVLVAALYNPRLFSLKGGVTNVEIAQELWDLDIDGGGPNQFSRKGRPTPPIRGVLPPVELTAEQREWRLLEAFTEFAQSHPERAKEVADRLMRVAEEKGGPRRERTLGVREAARRISAARGKELSSVQLGRYCREGLVGEMGPDGKPRFSEYECDHFVPPDRPPGRPRKIDEPLR